jgi:DNA-binding XRE family transcriptional regulator
MAQVGRRKGAKMAKVKLNDVRSVRKALGVSQSQAGRLLGVSTKAIQSYEQGTRAVPAHVQRAAALLFFARWRKGNGASAPCWKETGCRREVCETCPAFVQEAGDLCWMLTGTACRGEKAGTAEEKMARCQKCAVMTKWFKV